TIKMRKECAAARRFPLQAIVQLCGVNAHQQQVILTGEVLRRRFHDLGRVGKVDEPVAAVDLRTAKNAGAFGLLPQRGRADFINDGHWAQAAPRSSGPPCGGGIGAPSAAYSFSLLRNVRIEIPRMFAACVRLPRQCRSVSRIKSRSTSATVRPTRLRVICSAAMAACAATSVPRD